MSESPSIPDSREEASPPEQIAEVAEHLFRHEAGKLVATLTRIFGVQHLNRAEDVVQEALVKALQIWPYYGIPKNPSAWITQVAKNLALDLIRREKNFREKEEAIVAFMEPPTAGTGEETEHRFDDEIRDDRLRMLFVCCHPEIPQEAQVALALKTLCGFSTGEIAKAFLTNEAVIAKRLTRAKQRLREAGIQFEIPMGEELSVRLNAVLQTLYLLFNEGYKASGGDRLVRDELCHEAIRLTRLLVQHPAGDCPAGHALLALMLFNAARLESRADAEGNLLRLDEQDRSKWSPQLIAIGMAHLQRSAAGSELTEYHLQAGIAACHCAARDYASTDWPQILALYDLLVDVDGSPVVALNRAVAVANVHGAEAGLKLVEALRKGGTLDQYHLLYAVLGELNSRLGNFDVAAKYFGEASEKADQTSEKAFLKRRMEECARGVKAVA